MKEAKKNIAKGNNHNDDKAKVNGARKEVRLRVREKIEDE